MNWSASKIKSGISITKRTICLLIPVVLFGIVAYLHTQHGVPLGDLTRDPVVVAEVPAYVGFLSQMGLLCWSAAAAICLFSALTLAKTAGASQLSTYLGITGGFTLVLALDDTFMLHEDVLPHLGVPEIAVLTGYAGFTLFHLLRFRHVILRTQYSFMALALVLFGCSVFFDIFTLPGIDPFIVEDGAKFLGILSWLLYVSQAGHDALRTKQYLDKLVRHNSSRIQLHSR